MKEKLSRFCEDTYYKLLIHLRNRLERLGILHAPTFEELQPAPEMLFAAVAASTPIQTVKQSPSISHYWITAPRASRRSPYHFPDVEEI